MIEPYVPGTTEPSWSSSSTAQASSTRIVAQTWWPKASARTDVGIRVNVAAATVASEPAVE